MTAIQDRKRKLGENAGLECLDVDLWRRAIGDRDHARAAGFAVHRTEIGKVFGHGINVLASAGPKLRAARLRGSSRNDKGNR